MGIRRIWDKVTDIPYTVRDFFVRGKKGYSERDVWSFDNYLAGVISAGLSRLRETAHGYPIDMEVWSDCEDDRPLIWAAILTAIIDGFEAFNYVSNSDYIQDFPPHEDDLDNLLHWWTDDEWAEMHAIQESYWMDYEEGMALFAEFFPNLWD